MYNTQNPLEVENLKLRIDKLIKQGAMVEVVNKQPRSLKTNSYLHAILAYFGLQTGNTLDEVKSYYFKRIVNRDLFVRQKHDDILDTDREYLRSTTKLTQEEMSLAITRFRNWSSNIAGIYIFLLLMSISHLCTCNTK